MIETKDLKPNKNFCNITEICTKNIFVKILVIEQKPVLVKVLDS